MRISSKELQVISDHRSTQQPAKSLMQAAVTIILREGEDGTEFLLMQRAKHEHDPWSGQMSFPGGKIDPEDDSALAAAIREAEEEVGIKLNEDDYVGQLDDLYGLKVDNQFSVHVACFVFKPQRELHPKGNHEVAGLVWLPFNFLDKIENSIDYYHPSNLKMKMPAIMINAKKEQIFWGLSLRMITTFYELLGWKLRALSEVDLAAQKELENLNMDSSKLDTITKQLLLRETK